MIKDGINRHLIPALEYEIRRGSSEEYIMENFKADSISSVLTFENVLKSELVITNVRPSTYIMLVDCFRTLEGRFQSIRTADTVFDLYLGLNVINSYLDYYQFIKDLEVDNPRLSENEALTRIIEYNQTHWDGSLPKNMDFLKEFMDEDVLDEFIERNRSYFDNLLK